MAKSAVPSDTTALRDETMLRHVRQLGSAGDGLSEWRLQRLTAIALIPLSLYFVASVLWLATSDRITAAAWLSSPVTALLVMLFVLAGLAHALVGLRSVFLDYVHTRFRLSRPASSSVQPWCFSQAPAYSPSSNCFLAIRSSACPKLTRSSTIPSTSSCLAPAGLAYERRSAWSRPA